jgi:hypothetical protein
MITLKLKADTVRRIKQAKTPAELEGCRDMLITLIEQSETLKSFGPVKTNREPGQYNWREALDAVASVLGKENVTTPPYPDGTWIRGICWVLRRDCLTLPALQLVAEHARDHLRMPVSLDFLVRQSQKILAGAFDHQTEKKAAPAWRSDTLPDE